MQYIVGSEITIGNFILESVKQNNFSVPVKDLLNCEKALAEKLESSGYYAGFSYTDVMDFTNEYPFLVGHIIDGHILIHSANDRDNFILRLTRYFRIGVPSKVINAIEDICAANL